MAEFIIEQDDSFTVVTNTILRDKTLSMSAKGLLSTMLSLPPEWDYSFNGLVARRKALAFLQNDTAAVKKVFDELAPKYANRNGGYTRILKLDERRGDDALIVRIELVD